jgi:hypothetical protein
LFCARNTVAQRNVRHSKNQRTDFTRAHSPPASERATNLRVL